MFKVCILLIILLLFFWIAFEYKRNFNFKVKFYNEILNFINNFSSQLLFNKIRLIDYVSSYKTDNFVSKFVKCYYADESFIGYSFLSKEENDAIKDFFNSLRKYDVDETRKVLEAYDTIFLDKVKFLNQYYKTHIEPIFKIIILLGIAVVIVIL